ncbi:HAD-IIIA family hydrolase [Hymenobacter psychrophilus]|uniref:D,D-heptose 1,7-bisphosphate phosphatase n=1 Tax=Hymenobacter psychrophilus TaxID=651662 RepID=A0A1H3PAC0_9BACT|nr:HAD-IIIA family hydrolase [Hymenobacter psychrophilus]SDY98037.1 D-glycero-D-manno-heptose 1,7-bisphosphate phosphatase [Hymenobacter psychrophilus]
MKTSAALFLDLDHTLIRPKSGETFPKDADDWEFMPKMLNALWYDIHHTFRPIVIVTNQGGVTAGFHTIEEIEAKLAKVKAALVTHLRGNFDYKYPTEVYHYCAYNYDFMRKPMPGMAYQAAIDLNLDLSKSTMIGDMDSDEQFAKAVGMGFRHVDRYLGNVSYTAPLNVREG